MANELIVAYQNKIAELAKISNEADELLAIATEQSKFPENARKAKFSDLKEGAILWYHDGDDGDWFAIVEEVHGNIAYKAYTDHQGCRHGLDGAFIAVT
jgi:hypothetical protein